MRKLWAIALFLTACGPGTTLIPDGGNGGPDATPHDGSVFVDAPPIIDGAPVFFGKIYAHSYSDLYSVDPDTLTTTHIGPFLWPPEVGGSDMMTDIAVDKNGNITGVSFGSVYAVDHDTAACTYLAPLSREFNGLSFVPAGGVDMSDMEVLVGSTLDGSFWRIDPATGVSTQIGAYGGIYTSSGDIVSVKGFGTVATVKGSGVNDVLARIDPTTGVATPIGDTGFVDIWGLGYWKNKCYGFLSTNQFIVIDVTTGAGTLIDIGPQNWWGAGVTTAAPIIP